MSYTIESVRAALAEGETTIQQIAEVTGWPIVKDCLIPSPDVWHADDGNAEIAYDGNADAKGAFHYGHAPKVESGEEAAQDYVDTGDWGTIEETTWISVWAWREGVDSDGDIVRVDNESHKITIDPDEPECLTGQEHDWQEPHWSVGGCKEAPGVYGHGGGVTCKEVCMRCGCGKLTDTWAQDRSDGEQGLTSVSYEPRKYAAEVGEHLREQVEWTVVDDKIHGALPGGAKSYWTLDDDGEPQIDIMLSSHWPLTGDYDGWPVPICLAKWMTEAEAR